MENCDCVVCKHQHTFDLPKDLIDDLISDRLVLFVGAGISTESKNVLNYTFYDQIVGEMKLENCDLSFPDLMEKYCKQTNGRIKLLSKIRGRLEYIKSFPEMYGAATHFHSELSTIFHINTIITTNWDTYFEDQCNSIPFVSDQDLVFWNTDERKVLKIHGSINNYGSIVATATDYTTCLERLNSGLIGSILKGILATKTVVFIGYSLSDSDFANIFDFIAKQMKDLQRQAYVVTPFHSEQERLKKLGLLPIITDGTYFLSQLKSHLVDKKLMLSDSLYILADALRERVIAEHRLLHESYSCFDHPQIIIAASYQDGMLHALGRLEALRSSGKYSNPCYIPGVFKPYLDWRQRKLKDKIYEDVAYIEGYIYMLAYLTMDEETKGRMGPPPLYYAFGVKGPIHTLDDFNEVVNDLPHLHKSSYKRTLQMVAKLKSSSGIDFHHPPWL